MPLPLLGVRGLSKTFPGLRALDDVDLEIASGEVLALVGQNGSGKSTLVKVLTGVVDGDPGARIDVSDGEEVLAGAAARDGIHVIHQDLGLIDDLTTVENLDLGRQHGLAGLGPAHMRDEERRARELIGRFGAEFDVRLPVKALTAAERAIVAIARALDGWDHGRHVLVLDEPTAALHGDEVEHLFAAIRRVAADGGGVIFISHRLDEVLEIADRVVALRDGRVVADVRAGGFDHDALVEMIAGRALTAGPGRDAPAQAEEVLRADGLHGATVRGADLRLQRGEIVGVSGILGSGREHVAGLLFGALPRASGDVHVGGQRLRGGSPRTAISLGVAHVPADRRGEGAVMGMRARENLTLPRLGPFRRRLGRLDRQAEQEEADAWAGRVELAPADTERALELFSGGNQQKVVLAKWLRNDPKVLLLDEPTQGVDVGAKDAIYQLIVTAAAGGAAVLVSSSDTKELAALCDRVLVLREGRVAAELRGAALTEAALVIEGLGLRDPAADRLGHEMEASHA